jgi:hypothetical protein
MSSTFSGSDGNNSKTSNNDYDVNINSYTPEQLRILCDKLEEMPKINQVEVLRIFHKYNKEFINENNYGVHINVTNVQNVVLEEIEEYIKHVSKQETELITIDSQQTNSTNYILKDNKETSQVYSTG